MVRSTSRAGSSRTGIATSILRTCAARILVGFFVFLLIASGPVLAQETEGTPESDPAAIDTPAVAEDTPPVPDPTETPTEAPTEEATEPAEPLVEDDAPAQDPTEQAEETPASSTEIPAETPETAPEPSLQYLLAGTPECSLFPDQHPEIASGGEQEYACFSTLTLTGSSIVPEGVTVTWSIRASVEDGWGVQLLPPTNESDEPAVWTVTEDGRTSFRFEQGSPAGPGAEPAELDLEIRIDYQLRVLRPACAMTTPMLRLRHDAAVSSAGIEPVAGVAESEREPLRIEPSLAPVPKPSVSFAGPLSFGEIGATAAGLNETTRTGSVELVVSGLDQTCGTWDVRLSATPLADANGALLEGSRLFLTSVDNAPVPGAGCDLVEGCAAVSLSGGPEAQANQTIIMTLTLQMPSQAGLGAFSTALEASLAAFQAQE
jgi:hypothetical protein